MVSEGQSGSQESEVLALTLILFLAVRPWTDHFPILGISCL